MNATPSLSQPDSGETTSARPAARLRILRISAELFLELFKQGTHPGYNVAINAIPDNTRIVNVRFGWPECIEMLLESEEFDPVNDGEVIPYLSPTVERIP